MFWLRWKDPEYLAQIERTSAFVSDFLAHPLNEPLLTPAEVGAVGASRPYERKRIIDAAGVLAKLLIARDKELEGKTNVLVLDYIHQVRQRSWPLH